MKKTSPIKLSGLDLGQASGAPQRAAPVRRKGFCVFISTLLEGAGPAVRDAAGRPFVFATEVEAQREIADNMITRLQEFIDGERDFGDALTLEEYVVRVKVLPDGSVVDPTAPESALPRAPTFSGSSGPLRPAPSTMTPGSRSSRPPQPSHHTRAAVSSA